MQNTNHKLDFSERLRKLMIQQGHGSRSAASGASPAALCKAIDCYPEMALRYLDGRSIPSPDVLLKMAEWLDVNPGYLLFGEQAIKKTKKNKDILKFHKDLLTYALRKVFPVIKNAQDIDEALEFFISVLSDLSQMDIDNEQLKKVFDLAIKSSTFFEQGSMAGIREHGRPRPIS